MRLLKRAVAAEPEQVVPEAEREPEGALGVERVVAVPGTEALEGPGLE